jgi:hypothetical protein
MNAWAIPQALLNRFHPGRLVVLRKLAREGAESGAEDGTRTRDLLITNQLLYQLSYFGVSHFTWLITPATAGICGGGI